MKSIEQRILARLQSLKTELPDPGATDLDRAMEVVREEFKHTWQWTPVNYPFSERIRQRIIRLNTDTLPEKRPARKQ